MRQVLRQHLFTRLKRKNALWLFRRARQYLFLKYLRKLPKYRDGYSPAGPILANILPTYRCMSSCPMCTVYNRRSPDESRDETFQGAWGEISLEGLFGLLKELKNLGVPALSVSGGEPFVRTDLLDFIARAKEMDFSVSLSTNAIPLTPARAQRLIELKVDQVTVSLDTMDDKKYEVFRGTRGGLPKALEGLKNLTEAKKNLKGSTVINISNVMECDGLDELKAVVNAGESLGADMILLAPVHDFHLPDKPVHTEEKRLKTFDQAALNSFLEKVKREYRVRVDNSPQYLGLFKSAFEGKPFPYTCLTGYTMMTIDPYGNIYPCAPYNMLNRPIAHYKPGKLLEIWNSPGYQETRRSLMGCHACYWNCHAEQSILFQ